MAEEGKLVRLCSNCSAELPDEANICSSCGTAVRADGDSGESVGEMLVGFASGTAEEIRQTGETVLKSETTKKVAAGAAIGAVAAVVLPISIGLGAVIGAGIAAIRRVGKKA